MALHRPAVLVAASLLVVGVCALTPVVYGSPYEFVVPRDFDGQDSSLHNVAQTKSTAMLWEALDEQENLIMVNHDDADPTWVGVVWVTENMSDEVRVYFSSVDGTSPVRAETGGCYPLNNGDYMGFANRVVIRGLSPDTMYSYVVVHGERMSSELTFTTGPEHLLYTNPYDSNSNFINHVHLAYGDEPTEMVVMWATPAPSNVTAVTYGETHSNEQRAVGESWKFVGEGNSDGLQYYHRVVIKNLKPGVTYHYAPTTEQQVRDGFTFTAMPDDEDWVPRLLVYGDMGRDGGAQSLKLLKKQAASGDYDAVIHIGDFAYDLHDKGGVRGDEFMTRIEPITSRLPYMTAPGNHEIENHFSHYINRFSMPGNSENMYYSFNMSKIHFIAYSTEYYFSGDQQKVEEQYAWLEKELERCSSGQFRKERPWIVAYGHRPMYCSNADGDDCTTLKSKIRLALEDLFNKHKVDLIIEAHEHSYERMWPVYNATVTQNDYHNPKAPVHLISGAAGCNESQGWCLNPIFKKEGPWSAFRSWLPGFYGFGHLVAHNSTHLYWDQVLAELWGLKLDKIWIIQEEREY